MDILESVNKELEIIRPVEKRVQSLGDVFSPLFSWNETELRLLPEKAKECEQFIIDIPTDEDIKLLPKIEIKLQEIKQLGALKKKERTEKTGSFDKLKKRFMVIEETYDALATKLNNSRLGIAKLKQAAIEKEQKRQNELASFRTRLQTHFNDSSSKVKQYIQNTITVLYKHALENLDEFDVMDFISLKKEQNGVEMFEFPEFPMTAIEDADADKVLIYNEIIEKWIEQVFVDEFSIEMDRAFSNFPADKAEKEEALRIRENTASTIIEMVKEEAVMENTLAIIEGKAEVHVTSPAMTFETTKDIKVTYALDMADALDTLKAIDKAFYPNINKCLENWRGKSYLNISTMDKANMLCRIKEKDQVFQPTGIIFKQVDK